MKIQEIIQSLEHWAPPSLQEAYDNSGFLVGNRQEDVTGVLISLDITESIIDEAIEGKCNLIISHHPLIFQGVKTLTNEHWVQRCIIKAIKNDINIYAIHTNLDHVRTGVNFKMAQKIGLVNTKILLPKSLPHYKLITYIPQSHLNVVESALFAAGAGSMGNYTECSFILSGMGSFKPLENSEPFLGKVGERHTEPEIRLEVLVPAPSKSSVIRALMKSHPYEEVAYDLIVLANISGEYGSGMIGHLPKSHTVVDFLALLRTAFDTGTIRYTGNKNKPIEKIAICGGSGFFLLKEAINQKADALITADLKYHNFFDAEDHLLLADIGHYESEVATKELIGDFLNKNFANIAVRLSNINTNPIQYF